jgi:hypothetical protein
VQFFVKTLPEGKIITMNGFPSMTIGEIKDIIEKRDGTACPQQRLIYNGKSLADDHPLARYNIVPGCTVYLMLALRGD